MVNMTTGGSGSHALLERLRVLEVAEGIAPAYCSRLFADAGATVYVARDRIARADDYLADYLDLGKERVESRLVSDMAAFEAFVAQIDIVIFDATAETARAWFADLSGRSRPIVGVAVTPAGLDVSDPTPYDDDPLILSALTSFATATPEDPENRDIERPMQLWGHQIQLLGGLNAHVAALQAWFLARRNGQGSLVDCSNLSALAAHPAPSLAFGFVGAGERPGPAQRPPTVPRGLLRCRDGFVYTQGGDDNWTGWAKALGREEWERAPYNDPDFRAGTPEGQAVLTEIYDWLSSQPVADVYEVAQALGIVTFPVNTIGAVTEDVQVKHRKVVEPIELRGRQLAVPRTPVRVGALGPTPGTDIASRPGTSTLTDPAALPLSGLRVADFSWVIAGPRCTSWLGAMGADVIKVESHHRPDRARGNAPYLGEPEFRSSVLFNLLNTSKRGLALDLSKPAGRELALDLVASVDVVVENFSTSAASRLGLTYEALSKVNPSLVMVSASGLGRTGPHADYRAFGKSIHAFSGHTYLHGWPGTPPRGTASTWTDPMVGVVATAAILQGVAHRSRTGRGVYFDLSMVEATLALLCEAFIEFGLGRAPGPLGNASDLAVHDTFRCLDGKWVAVVGDQRAATKIAAIVGGELDGRVPEALRAWCRTRSSADVLRSLAGPDLRCVPVHEPATVFKDAPSHTGLRWRPVSVEGVGTMPAVELPWVQYPMPPYVYEPAPSIGQHTDVVLREVLGLGDDGVQSLGRAGVTL